MYSAVLSKHGSLLYPILTLLPFTLIWSITGYWAYLDPHLISSSPRLFLIASGSAMSITTIRLMLAHICNTSFHDPIKCLVFISPWLLAGCNAVFHLDLLPTLTALYLAAYTGVAILGIYAYLLVQDMTQCLNIQVFSIKHKVK